MINCRQYILMTGYLKWVKISKQYSNTFINFLTAKDKNGRKVIKRILKISLKFTFVKSWPICYDYPEKLSALFLMMSQIFRLYTGIHPMCNPLMCNIVPNVQQFFSAICVLHRAPSVQHLTKIIFY